MILVTETKTNTEMIALSKTFTENDNAAILASWGKPAIKNGKDPPRRWGNARMLC